MNEAIEEQFFEEDSFSAEAAIEADHCDIPMSTIDTVMPACDLSASVLDSFFDLVKHLQSSPLAAFLIDFWYFQQCVHDFCAFARGNADFPVFSLKSFLLCFCYSTVHRAYLEGIPRTLDRLGAFTIAFAVTIPLPQMYRVYRRSALGVLAIVIHAAQGAFDVVRIVGNAEKPAIHKILAIAGPLIVQEIITGPFRGESEEASRILIIVALAFALKRAPAALFTVIVLCELIDATADFQGGSRGAFYYQIFQAITEGCLQKIVQESRTINF